MSDECKHEYEEHWSVVFDYILYKCIKCGDIWTPGKKTEELKA